MPVSVLLKIVETKGKYFLPGCKMEKKAGTFSFEEVGNRSLDF